VKRASTHTRSWKVVEEEWAARGSTRTASALKNRAARLRRRTTAGRLSPTPPPSSAGSCGASSGPDLDARTQVFGGLELRQPTTVAARTAWCGRPWPYALRGRTGEVRPGHDVHGARPQERHARLITALRLDTCANGHRLLFCDMERARRALIRHGRRSLGAGPTDTAVLGAMTATQWDVVDRDRLRIVQYATDTLPTMLESRFRCCWIGGPDGGRYADGTDLARWFGLQPCARTRQWWEVPIQYTRGAPRAPWPRHVWQAVAASMVMPFAVAVVEAALLLTDRARTTTWRYAALYAGGIDAYACALRQAGVSFDYTAAAEIKRSRRAMLQGTWRPRRLFSTAKEAARELCERLDWVSWTPPCPDLSRGQQLGRCLLSRAARRRRAVRRTVRAARHLHELVRRTQPAVVTLEQVADWRKYHQASWRATWAVLRDLPYDWHIASVDGARLGSPTTRMRLAGVGIRR
jgi:hypothetical protein